MVFWKLEENLQVLFLFFEETVVEETDRGLSRH